MNQKSQEHDHIAHASRKSEVISSLEEYRELFFPRSVDATDPLREALKIAMENRKLEIDLYWRRAAYYWTFIGATFVAYGTMSKVADGDQDLLIAISCLGVVFSFAWWVAMRGAKYWHQNWERHVDALEDLVVGPIHKLVVPFEDSKWWHFTRPHAFSATKINAAIGLYVSFIWSFLLAKSISERFGFYEPFRDFNAIILVAGSAVATFFIVIMCGTTRKPYEFRFKLRDKFDMPCMEPSKCTATIVDKNQSMDSIDAHE